MDGVSLKSEGLRVLVLDGGDIRAVSQLDILEELIHRIKWKEKLTSLTPCEYFHVMIGVGTGGLLVILLVILRLTTYDAKEEFIKIYKSVFEDEECEAAERSVRLEDMVHYLLHRKGFSPDLKLCDPEGGHQGCLAIVCASPAVNVHACRKFRNYPCQESSLDPTVIEVVRAACAYPKLFEPVYIGPLGREEEFVTANLSLNNPTREAIREIYDHFGQHQLVACIMNLGCGKPGPATFTRGMDDSSLGNMTDSALLDGERTASDLQTQIGPTRTFYRFSVDQGLTNAERRLALQPGTITSHTKVYLAQGATSRAIDNFLDASGLPGKVTAAELQRSQTKPLTTNDGLPSLSAFYVDRIEAISVLKEKVNGPEEGGQLITVVSGMGGTGKTQLVSKFARDHRERFPVVLFIDASSVQTIRDGLITRLRRIGHRCKTIEEAVDVLATWDEARSGRWLIIFDNADNPSVSLSEFFPPCDYGTIIITTRNQSLGQLAPEAHLELDTMTQDEAVNLLLSAGIGPHKIYTEAQRKAGKEIADQLGHLPIALVQAGSYIKQRRCLTTFLDRLLNSRPKILQHPVPPQLDRYKHGTYGMLDIAMKGLPKRARQFLYLLSFAHHSNFPRPLIALAAQHHFVLEPCDLIERPETFSSTTQLLHNIFCRGGEWDEDDFDDTVVDLQTASLIVISEDGDNVMLSLHPLLHAWAQDQLPTIDKDLYRDGMARLLSNGTGPQGAFLHEHLLSHINAMSPYWGSLHINDRASFADVLAFPGIADDTVLIWEGVYEEVKQHHGAISAQTYQVALRLGHAYATQGDDKRYETMQNELMQMASHLTPPTQPPLVPSSENMEGPALNDLENEDDSQTQIASVQSSRHAISLEARIQNLVEIDIAKLPRQPWRTLPISQDPEFLETMNGMAMKYEKEARYAEARVLGRELFVAQIEAVGLYHPDTLQVKNYLKTISNAAAGQSTSPVPKDTELSRNARGDSTNLRKGLLPSAERQSFNPASPFNVFIGSHFYGSQVINCPVRQGYSFANELHHDFDPFRHGEVVGASQVSSIWPYNGKRFRDLQPLITIDAAAPVGIPRPASLSLIIQGLVNMQLDGFIGQPWWALSISQEPGFLEGMNLMAAQYEGEARYIEAKILGKELLATHMYALGEDHPETIRAKMYLEMARKNVDAAQNNADTAQTYAEDATSKQTSNIVASSNLFHGSQPTIAPTYKGDSFSNELQHHFNPFRYSEVVDASQVSSIWPYNGKRFQDLQPLITINAAVPVGVPGPISLSLIIRIQGLVKMQLNGFIDVRWWALPISQEPGFIEGMNLTAAQYEIETRYAEAKILRGEIFAAQTNTVGEDRSEPIRAKVYPEMARKNADTAQTYAEDATSKQNSNSVEPSNLFHGLRPIIAPKYKGDSFSNELQDYFNPFRHSRAMDASQVLPLWPYNGKRSLDLRPRIIINAAAPVAISRPAKIYLKGARDASNVSQGQQQFYQNTRFPAGQNQGYSQQQVQEDSITYQRW